MDTERTLQTLIDEAQITRVLTRYTRALDAGDLPGVRSCLAPDVQLAFHDKDGNLHTLDGPDLVVEMVASLPSGRGIELDSLEACTHLLGQADIEVRGDEADCETVGVSFLTGPIDGERTTLIRGIRYRDTYRRVDGSWLLRRRETSHEWMCRGAGMTIHG